MSSTDVNFIASQAIARAKATAEETNGDHDDGDARHSQAADAMAALERQSRAPVGFVAASSGPEGGNRPAQLEQPMTVSEIDIGDD